MDNIFFMQELARERIQRYMGEAENYRQLKSIRRSKGNSVPMIEKIQNMISVAGTMFHQAPRAQARHAPQEC